MMTPPCGSPCGGGRVRQRAGQRAGIREAEGGQRAGMPGATNRAPAAAAGVPHLEYESQGGGAVIGLHILHHLPLKRVDLREQDTGGRKRGKAGVTCKRRSAPRRRRPTEGGGTVGRAGGLLGKNASGCWSRILVQTGKQAGLGAQCSSSATPGDSGDRRPPGMLIGSHRTWPSSRQLTSATAGSGKESTATPDTPAASRPHGSRPAPAAGSRHDKSSFIIVGRHSAAV